MARCDASRTEISDAGAGFFRVLDQTGDLGLAAAATTRDQLRAGNLRARNLAQVLQQQSGTARRIGDICMTIAAVTGEIPRTAELPSKAWQLFTTANLDEVLRLAPAEYLRTAFGQDPERAADALARLLAGEYRTDADAAAWLDIAATSFLAERAALSRGALERAVAGLAEISDAGARTRLDDDAQWLRSWYGRGDHLPESDLPAVAVLGYRAPDRARSSRNLGDYLESLATLNLLARHSDFVADTNDALGAVVEQLCARTGNAARSDSPTVRLFAVDRDASPWAQIPDGTWVVYTGVLPQPLFGVRRDLPLDRRLRPIFLSVHVDSAHALSGAAIEYLREHGPIGCRDWSTVLLLQAADVPAFFAGSVTSTLGSLDRSRAARTGALAVDVPGHGEAEFSLVANAVHRRDLADNLRAALDHVDALAAAQTVRTSRVHSYVAARALGTPVDFEPDNPTRRWLWGLQHLDEAALNAMRRGIADKLAAVYGAILAGSGRDEVYATWRAVCVDDVEKADSFRARVPSMPPPVIDVAAACATIRAASVNTERTVLGAGGSEINVEFPSTATTSTN